MLSIRLKGLTCGDKTITDNFSTGGNYIPANKEFITQGNWHLFKRVTEVLKVEIWYVMGSDKYYILYDQEKGINETYINGKTAKQIEEEKRKKQATVKSEPNLTEKKIDYSPSSSSSAAAGASGAKSSGSSSGSSSGNSSSSSKSGSGKSSSSKSSSSKGSKSSGSGSTMNTTYESDSMRNIRLRSEAQRSRDANEDVTMGTVVGVAGAGMAYMITKESDDDDSDLDLPLYLKVALGLSMQNIPVIENSIYNNTQKSSMATTTNHIAVDLGLIFSVFNDRFVSFQLHPTFSYGMNAFVSGVNGTHMSYGGDVGLSFGRKFKFYLLGGYQQRQGEMTSDYAVSGINSVGESSYNYFTLQYGAGLAYYYDDWGSYFKLSGYKENISFLKDVDAKVYSYRLEAGFKFAALGIQFAPNYPIAGELKNPSSFTKDKQNLMIFYLYVPLTIAKVY
jgi:hypothetical protein